MSFPPATEMFQFAGFASAAYGFSYGYRSRGGLPHSEIPGSPIARISPGLFAACRVLHRLSVPRHPPDALLSLRTAPNGKDHNEPRRCTRNVARADCLPGIDPGDPCHRRGKLFSPEDTSRGTRRSLSAARDLPLRSHNSLLHDGHQHHARPSQQQGAAGANLQSSRRVPSRRPAGSGGDRARTDALLLAKQALSQLSYTPVANQVPGIRDRGSDLRSPISDLCLWWAREDLNLRPHAYQARALTS
jgi:hypothetical protein